MNDQQTHGQGGAGQRRRHRRRHDDLGPGGRAELCHDLRGPAAAIAMLADVAGHESADPMAVRRRLRQIAEQARWLAALLESGVDGDQPRMLDLGGLVVDCLEPVAQLGQTGVRTEFSPGGPYVIAPPVSLRRALCNVIDNATRAAGPGGEVAVRLVQVPGAVVVEVDDSGPGFGRIPTVNGLGLQITHEALSSMGGRLAISQTALGGARVRLTVPVVPARDGAMAVPS